jgi:predicted Holliday junction resolvase-like endonuclease
MDTENKGGNITDTFFNKLKEQSFTIILLVGILYYQNVNFKSQIEEYKKMIDEKEALVLKLTDDERQRLLEREQYLREQRDKYIEDLIDKK